MVELIDLGRRNRLPAVHVTSEAYHTGVGRNQTWTLLFSQLAQTF